MRKIEASSSDNALPSALLDYAAQQFGTAPEYPWMTHPGYAVLRHSNKKWYALIMQVPRNKLGLPGTEPVAVMNIKCGPILSGSLRMQDGILPAWHMNKASWVTVLLDGTVAREQAFSLLNLSYEQVTNKSKTEKSHAQHIGQWIIPANPKYFDVDAAFAKSNVILWKQSSNVAIGDTVYLYLAAPYSAIRYKCRAVEVDIPYEHTEKNVTIRRAMRIQLLQKYETPVLGLSLLRAHDVRAVRGPRSIPETLVLEIEHIYGKK